MTKTEKRGPRKKKRTMTYFKYKGVMLNLQPAASIIYQKLVVKNMVFTYMEILTMEILTKLL